MLIHITKTDVILTIKVLDNRTNMQINVKGLLGNSVKTEIKNFGKK